MATGLGNMLADGAAPMPWRKVAGVLLAAVLPPVVAVAAFGPAGAVAFIAAMPAHLAAKESGIQVAVLVTLVTGIGGVLALGDPDMALLVAACLAAMTAIACHHGFARPCLRALFTWAVFTGPILPAEDKPLLLVLYVTAMVWSLGVTRAFGDAAEDGRGGRSTPAYSLIFGLALGIGLVVSVWVGGRYFGEHGFWFPLTFAVLWLPPFGQLFSRTMKRTLGTLLGTAAALALAWASGEGAAGTVLAVLALPFAFRMLPRSYLVFTALLTFVILEALALVSEVDRLAAERVTTMFAAAVMTLGLAATIAGALKLLAPDVLEEMLEGPDRFTRPARPRPRADDA
ncbi:FUSC family protein [Roseivivax sp. CAU 1761]